MPFDPISWAAGFVMTNAARKGLEVAFPTDFRAGLEEEIEKWSKALPETASVHPTTLFSVVDKSDLRRNHLQEIRHHPEGRRQDPGI
jgi:hypothetical protein